MEASTAKKLLLSTVALTADTPSDAVEVKDINFGRAFKTFLNITISTWDGGNPETTLWLQASNDNGTYENVSGTYISPDTNGDTKPYKVPIDNIGSAEYLKVVADQDCTVTISIEVVYEN